ncbi:MAG: SatD family protein [Dermatophilaceae bacterium]
MARMKVSSSPPCHVLADIVGSRRAADRRALHRAVDRAARLVGDDVPALRPLRVTVGDEVQGSYRTLGAALEAAFRLRLALLPEVDVRVGVGRGTATVLDADRGIEDGPGWWAARAAVEAVEAASNRAVTRHLRTGYQAADADDTAADAVAAALLCRDHIVGSLSDRSLRLLKGLLDPHATQADLAAAEGISPSAVSQRVRADGVGAVLAAHALLAGLP